MEPPKPVRTHGEVLLTANQSQRSESINKGSETSVITRTIALKPMCQHHSYFSIRATAQTVNGRSKLPVPKVLSAAPFEPYTTSKEQNWFSIACQRLADVKLPSQQSPTVSDGSFKPAVKAQGSNHWLEDHFGTS